MQKKLVLLSLAVMIALVLCLAPASCGGGEETGQNSGSSVESGDESLQTDPSRTVTMNGRSVMGGWMEHWGFKWEGPVEHEGCYFDYKELNADDIASSFADNVKDLAPGSVTFFKFCFEDFDGSNLSQRQAEIEEVIETARTRGLKLIIGNALPVRMQDGSPEMLEEYARFNEFLSAKASENRGVWIFDFYSVLAGPDGWLKPEYQTEDSHPNGTAYAALDPSFFELVRAVFAN